MKKFEIPTHYKSSIISGIKEKRKAEDPRKKNYKPTELNFGPVKFFIARHFGFCYGVENAIEIAYKTIDENPGKRIFLLSEMIHNPNVNMDMKNRGIDFIMDNYGNQFIEWDKINNDDIVIIPAFGTTVDIEDILKEKGIDTVKYNTTCPFVEKVWNRAESIGKQKFTIIVHGKAKHEETRATFSRCEEIAPTLIVRDIKEAELLSDVILGRASKMEFYSLFNERHSKGFDVQKDLDRIGVVNQTTMLASETQAIADLLKNAIEIKYGKDEIKNHFADTRDTLCYATNDNQSATLGLLEEDLDIAFVIGGYNSSNTSHLVELLEKKYPTYFISDSKKIISKSEIEHFNLSAHKEIISRNYIPQKEIVKIAITSGASCPDSIVDEVIFKLLSFFDGKFDIDGVMKNLK